MKTIEAVVIRQSNAEKTVAILTCNQSNAVTDAATVSGVAVECHKFMIPGGSDDRWP